MVKWIRLFGNQYLGFWAPGLLLFALQEVPYILMPLFRLEANPIMNMRESSVFLDVCEKALGSACIAAMIFVVHRDAALFSASGTRERLFLSLAAAALLLNFTGWALYFTGRQSIFVMMFLSSRSRRCTMFLSACGGKTRFLPSPAVSFCLYILLM